MVDMTRRNLRSSIIGMVYGNGFIDNKHYYLGFRCNHDVYCQYKVSILQSYQKQIIEPYRGYVKTVAKPLYRVLYKYLYKDNNKIVTAKALSYLNPYGIAIWYLDKGVLRVRESTYELYINTPFTKEDNELIIKYFEQVYGIRFGLMRRKDSYKLRLGAKQADKFIALINPYVLDELKHKLDPTPDI